MMKRSIFARLMWLSITIILTSAVIMGAVHLALIHNYVLETRTESITESAERLGEITAVLVQNYTPAMERIYLINLDYVANSTQSYIIVTDLEGNVFNCSAQAKRFVTEEQIDISGFEDIGQGKNISRIGALKSIFGEEVFTIAVPIKMEENVLGAIFLSSPIPDFYREKNTMFYILLVSTAISSMIAFILSYFISKIIVRPINVLSDAAHDIAKGNFDKRVTVSEVSELAELGGAFNTMTESIQRHEDVRSAFIANVSHDLRTPMTTISGFVGGILDGTIPPERRDEYLKIVLGESKRLSRLVSTFLDISRYEASEVKLSKTAFDIIEMIRVALLTFEKTVNERFINVYFEFGEENIFVTADENEIYRVVVNLIDNAVKFTDDGGLIEVIVTVKNGKVQVSVSNSGAGISEADRAYIWDRFYKADKSRTEPKKGFGLGLYIVKSIINRHGETIYLSGRTDKTEFVFTLPPV